MRTTTVTVIHEGVRRLKRKSVRESERERMPNPKQSVQTNCVRLVVHLVGLRVRVLYQVPKPGDFPMPGDARSVATCALRTSIVRDWPAGSAG